MTQEISILNNWEKAKLAIANCKTIDEVKSIRDKAEALRAYAKQAKESLEVQNNVAEIKIRCERKIGEFSIELPKEQGGKTRFGSSHDGENQSKTSILKEAGIQHYERYESIANLPEKEFESYIQDVKKSNEELTSIGLLRVARKSELPKKNNIQPPEGKYQVIYCDPPWAYDVDLSKNSSRSPENNYPVMELEDLIEFGEKVKDISHKDCILFMWITAPKLNWMNDVLKAWDFTYRTCLIWDKIKPNMGHYSSVRHEILIIAGKGNCSPTCSGVEIQSIDSVQSIEKSTRHSEKPKEFIEIIEKLYPNYKKIELFARNKEKRGNWNYWGNENV